MNKALIHGLLSLAVVLLGPSICLAQKTAGKGSVQVILLSPADDVRLDKTRLEKAFLGQAGGSAVDGLTMAIEDASFELDAAKLALEVQAIKVTNNEDLRAQLGKVLANTLVVSGVAATPMIVSELGVEQLRLTTEIAGKAKVAVLNVAEAQDVLREGQCAFNAFHLIPSERMLTDALGQALLTRKWSKVLLLHGESADDKRRTELAERVIKKFGLKLAAKKAFKLSADPRERERANLALLASGVEFDVAWVVDSDGEFARSVPYRLPLPRPVVGDAGLVPVAWDARFERFGAPQPSKAFAKAFKRPMTGHDWAAWMAGKAVVQSLLATQSKKLSTAQASREEVYKTLVSASFKLDGSKGQVMSFRAWDRQLRQPLMFSDGQGVIGMAPADGVMHPASALDTLGADAPEKLCKAAL